MFMRIACLLLGHKYAGEFWRPSEHLPSWRISVCKRCHEYFFDKVEYYDVPEKTNGTVVWKNPIVTFDPIKKRWYRVGKDAFTEEVMSEEVAMEEIL
jgi:hypothetical protein